MARRLREEFDAAAMPHVAALLRTATRLCGARDAAEDLVRHQLPRVALQDPDVQPLAGAARSIVPAGGHGPRLGAESALQFDPHTPDTLTAASVRAAFDGLPEPFRVAVLLVDVEELSYRGAADALEVPIGTVMSRLNRGRRLVRLALVKQAAAYGRARAL